MPRRTEGNLGLLRDLVASAEPELTPESIVAAIRAAAPETAILGKLARSIATDPGKLLTAHAAAIPSHSRLVIELIARGAKHVLIPECALCEKQVMLKYAYRDRRICGSCYKTAHQSICQQCHKVRPVAKKLNGLPLCIQCYRTAPQRSALCSKCGTLSPIVARIDGSPVCQLCHDRPRELCSKCGDLHPVHSRLPALLCRRCYSTMLRGREPQKTTVVKHRPLRTRDCTMCGQHRLCLDFLTDQPRCVPCAGRPEKRCISCQRQRPVQAYWAIGPVCNTCYDGKPGRCTRCGSAGLVLKLESDNVCFQCAGRPAIVSRQQAPFVCSACHNVTRLFKNRRCARCSLDIELIELIKNREGEINPELIPLRALLLEHPTPKTILGWLRRSTAGVAIVKSLASAELEISHATFDRIEPNNATNFVRSMLISSGILPERSEQFARLQAWCNRFFKTCDSADRNVLDTFAQWHLLRRLRGKAARNQITNASNSWARQRIRVAAALLSHLRTLDKALVDCGQLDLDEWIANGPTTRYSVRDFVRWAVRRRLTDELDVPQRKTVSAAESIANDERWAIIRRLASGEIEPLDLRIAGALNLLFGQQSSRIVGLTDSDVSVIDDDVCILLGSEHLPLPPPFDQLIMELITLRRSELRAKRNDGSVFLFPGNFYSRAVDVGRFTERLNEIGIMTRSGRDASLMDLAAKIPAALLRDLLGLHINTAVEWNIAAGHSHTKYIKRLKTDRGRKLKRRDSW